MVGNPEVTVPWWQGMLLGFVPFIGQLTIAGAVIVWVLSLFVL